MRTIDEVTRFLEEALRDGVRNRLVARGEARSMMRRRGAMPDDAPVFARAIDTDLAEFGFATLDAALELKALEVNQELQLRGFELAARVFDALVKNGDPRQLERGFYRVISGAAYHLASYSAVAFALFSQLDLDDLNLSPLETALVRLILRDMDGLQEVIRVWVRSDGRSGANLTRQLREGGAEHSDVYADIVISAALQGLSYFEFALKTGHDGAAESAFDKVKTAHGLSGEAGLVTLWWITRLIGDLLRSLWAQSLHVVLPLSPNSGESAEYRKNRSIYIASLYSRSAAHVELWPSQIESARRAADPEDDLVVALPTSAGKTRIAELAALTAVSLGKRVLLVTPLRALSAQTERSFREIFAPLGIRVSSLYGKSGVSAGDVNALVSDPIVVTTPEKLDFALRSDPDVIDDVGLIVLDESHLIGPSDREVRYEILVQRLLRRGDAAGRRIVCLSAILPAGEALDDMTSWIRSDEEGDAVRADWRPTRQRFGTLEWYGDRATLRYDLEEDGPFLSRFITSVPPRGLEKIPYPRDLKGVTVMSAWKLAEEGKRTLIFVTQANWVEGFAKEALKLVQRGYLPSLLEDPHTIQDALAIGTEWLGPDHPAVKSLEIGVAVHHGKLPSPFLREVERLLASGIIKVTTASPTLAQGLNLNAAVLLVPYLTRSGVPISGEELANTAGRAGRAFVDREGLTIHVIMDRHASRKTTWRGLVAAAHARTLTSGLMLVVEEVAQRLSRRGVHLTTDGVEFLLNAREAWLDEPADLEDDEEPIEVLIARLDAIVLGLVEALDADADNLPQLLDEALNGSFWARQVARKSEIFRSTQRLVMRTRAKLIWTMTTAEQRKGHYTMGVGLDSGLILDDLADELFAWIDDADLAAMQGDIEVLADNLVPVAERLLSINPFAPTALEEGWHATLRLWLDGVPIADIGEDQIALIEDVFMYRLVWALEAIRVRRLALGWEPELGIIAGAAASCVDTGLPSYRMSMLVRAGLASRSAAMAVVVQAEPDFTEPGEMRDWLLSETVEDLSTRGDWPTEETHAIWIRFLEEFSTERRVEWRIATRPFRASDRFSTALDDPFFRIEKSNDEKFELMSADYKPLGTLVPKKPLSHRGVLYGEWDGDSGRIISIAPDDPK